MLVKRYVSKTFVSNNSQIIELEALAGEAQGRVPMVEPLAAEPLVFDLLIPCQLPAAQLAVSAGSQLRAKDFVYLPVVLLTVRAAVPHPPAHRALVGDQGPSQTAIALLG